MPAPKPREPFSARIQPEFKQAVESYVESRKRQGWKDLRTGHVMEALIMPLLTEEGRAEVDALLQLSPEGTRPIPPTAPDITLRPGQHGRYTRTYYGFRHAGRTPRKHPQHDYHIGTVVEFATPLERDQWVADGEFVGEFRVRAQRGSKEVRAWLRRRPEREGLYGPDAERPEERLLP